ncbi:MAG: MarR family transcriptional regulator [Bosea sp. (in: a-proteobacteria)]|uniref:MarR family winged helix-turn-helix transcriptional regulator n=1 Tax=Bosea sp. (in: a-proteobacteria) TaxID=1871050 RepID=UPI00273701D8|nr:MarR family transcriptional regulator [Bosea sp. (in: a-proteobacteria)]MDP3601739.1 MarR family transcriptional regulator [Bosea sp. (in: a-proteobacteria)]
MERPLRRELMFQMVETARLMRTHVDQRAREHGTTRAQWGVLSRLRRREGQNQVAMAEQLDMQPISVARLIDRLEGQGLVERRADPADRRAHLLHLTDQGRALVEGLDALRTEIAAELLGGVEDEALRATLDTLATIRSRIRDGRRERQAGPTVPTAATAGAA